MALYPEIACFSEQPVRGVDFGIIDDLTNIEARSICRKKYGKTRVSGAKLISQKVTQVTRIPAKVLNVHKLYNEYLVTVQVGRKNYPGKFDNFGENKPHFGWYHYGRLDLIFLDDPYLDAGQEFPLWTNM